VAQPNVQEPSSIDERAAPFSITLVFPNLDDPDFPEALELARQSPGFRETGAGPLARYSARFLVGDTARLLDVFNVVGRSADIEILVDDQAVPYGRELWIPLVSLFINP
jgi:hypothetical protein